MPQPESKAPALAPVVLTGDGKDTHTQWYRDSGSSALAPLVHPAEQTPMSPADSGVRPVSPIWNDHHSPASSPRRDSRIRRPAAGSVNLSAAPRARRRWLRKWAEPLPLVTGTRFNVSRTGIRRRSRFRDVYHNLLDVRWAALLLCSLALWTSFVVAFAGLYKLHCWGGFKDVASTVSSGDECRFVHLLYFSFHTFSTTGYGISYPNDSVGQFIAGLEMWSGMTFACCSSAFAYSKMSRPSKLREGIIFSQCCVMNHSAPAYRYDHIDAPARQQDCIFTVERGRYASGERCLQFRVGHTHTRQHISPRLRLYLYEEWNKALPNGAPTRTDAGDADAEAGGPVVPVGYAFTELEWHCTMQHGRVRGLELSTPLPCLPFTVTHAVDEHSPLLNVTPLEMKERRHEIVAVYDAVDEGCSDSLQVRHSWKAEDVLWGVEFADMVFREKTTGRLLVDFQRLDEVVPSVDASKAGFDSRRTVSTTATCGAPIAEAH
eukprot:TRINITY_DN1386_c0_g1_i1.p1 TRINITY_DN1386_c0_g1~~TRINITY_DN1386_c0_g1_i1.p1  ORF type:complete len:490 (+),score=124.72 TRINITY_DN1386_c0_g1_i1:107-1576(+)